MRLYLPVVFGFVALTSAAQSGLVSPSADRADFRKANWGMTKAQVLASERKPPSDIRESSGEVIVRYDSAELAGMKATALYFFADDRLVRAKYLVDAAHDELNDFIADYRAIEPLLAKTYGDPTLERAVWEDDSLQEERTSYLDQDRATPESILPSDRNVGLAVSLGHLKLYTERGKGGTKVLHAMTGAEGKITHQIEYRRAEPNAPGE